MKNTRKYIAALAVFAAGSVFYGSLPAQAKGIELDEVKIVVRGHHGDVVPPPSPPEMHRHHGHMPPPSEVHRARGHMPQPPHHRPRGHMPPPPHRW